MRLLLTLSLLVGCGVGGSSVGRAAAPPGRKPAIKCEMRRCSGKVQATFLGKPYSWDIPGAAEVTITNISDSDVDIGSSWGPDAHLDLQVKDPAGAVVKTKPLSGFLALQSFEPKPYILKPGKCFCARVELLGMVPEEKRVAGTYKAKAVYEIGDKKYESAWVEVKWP